MSEFDIAILGATPAGITAGVAAKRHNPDLRVGLIEPAEHIGGMTASGLGYTDIGDPRAVGGLTKEFYAQLEQHYEGRLIDDFAGPEPHVAEAVFRQLLETAGVELELARPLQDVKKQGSSIKSITSDSGREVQAGVWIDATYEGDLMAKSGVSYAIGRDGSEAYGEDRVFAGRQGIAPGKHNFIGLERSALISPFRADSTELLPFIRPFPLEQQGPEGSGDRGVMAYQYRLCLTDNPDNRAAFEAPDNYNADDYELLFRYVQKLGDISVGSLIGLIKNIPNDKVDANSRGPVSLNVLDGSNWEYPDADEATRRKIAKQHLDYAKGFCYTLANDARIPRHIRQEFQQWGLAKDEFQDTDHWPHQLYVREARRMIGEYVLTQHDIHPGLPKLNGKPLPREYEDTVMVGSYNIDIREVQRTWKKLLEFDNIPMVVNEGYLSCPVNPYQIPYRSFVPKAGEVTNLLVPVCASMSHVAFSSFRMEPGYMMSGQVAGTAAAMARENAVSVQEVGETGSKHLDKLQSALRNAGHVIFIA